jgi:hypothetical protein
MLKLRDEATSSGKQLFQSLDSGARDRKRAVASSGQSAAKNEQMM